MYFKCGHIIYKPTLFEVGTSVRVIDSDSTKTHLYNGDGSIYTVYRDIQVSVIQAIPCNTGNPGAMITINRDPKQLRKYMIVVL